MQSNARRLLVILLLLVIQGCQTMTTRSTATTSEDSVRVACEAFLPMGYSADEDTPETVDAIKQHNAVYCELCPTYSFCPQYLKARQTTDR